MGSTRIMALDGLRGIAALSVVAFHFMCCFAPQLVPEYSAAVPWWVDTPLGLLFNGGFAVSLFFVLSGFVLAAASDRRVEGIWIDAFTRWLRLAIPATASVVIAWGLLRWMPTSAAGVEKLIKSPWHSFTHQESIPSLYAAVLDGAILVFVRGGSLFNNVLWTMRYELIGSLGIYAFYFAVKKKRLAGLVIAGTAMLLAAVRPGLVAFVLGAIARELTVHGFKPSKTVAAMLLCAGVAFGFQSAGFAARHGLDDLPPRLQIGESGSVIAPFAAFLSVLAITQPSALAAPLRTPAALFLGRISFSLYLLHVPLLYTVVAEAVSRHGWLSPWQLVVVFGFYALLSVTLAWLFERAVDAPTLRLNSGIRRSALAFVKARTGEGRTADHVNR